MTRYVQLALCALALGAVLVGWRPPAAPAATASPSVRGDAAADTVRTRQVYVEADSLIRFERDGESVIRLEGHVRVRQDSTTLYARRALQYVARETFLFTGDVLIVERGDSLRADTVFYEKRTKEGRARGRVYLTDGDVQVRAPSGHYFTDEKRTRFEDGVTLIDSTARLTSRQGTYWSDEKRAELDGAVQLHAERTHLEADSLTYFRETEVSIARSNVFIDRIGGEDDAEVDSTLRTLLFGRRAYNDDRAGFSEVEGHPLLLQLRQDSSGAVVDTFVVRARRLAFVQQDSVQRLIAVDSVRIWRRDYAALADSVVYERLRPLADTVSAFVPTADTLATDTPPVDTRSAYVSTADTLATNTRATETPRHEETRLFGQPLVWVGEAQVSGDSIRVKARGGDIDSLFVRRGAFVAQRDTVIDRIQQVKGQHLVGVFEQDATRTFTVGPNAEAIYFQKNDANQPDGGLKASGDRAVFFFRGDRPQRIDFTGDPQGTYYAEGQLPDPFELDGFRWQPDRRPTLHGLLREPRIIRRLEEYAMPPAVRPFEAVPPTPDVEGPTSEASETNDVFRQQP